MTAERSIDKVRAGQGDIFPKGDERNISIIDHGTVAEIADALASGNMSEALRSVHEARGMSWTQGYDMGHARGHREGRDEGFQAGYETALKLHDRQRTPPKL